MSLASRALLMAALVVAPLAPLPGAPGGPAPGAAWAQAAAPDSPDAAGSADSAEGRAVAERLRDALSSGEWDQVRLVFEQADSPVLAYLAQRWHDMRRGALDPVAWEVSFDAFDARPAHLAGQLSVAARLADGGRVGRRFDVHLASRAGAWRVGELVRYDDQDARVTAHALTVDLRGPAGSLVAEDALTVEPSGPDRALYLALLPSLRVAEVRWNGQPLRFAQRREVLYVERPDAPGPQVLTVRYAGVLPESELDFVRASGTVLRSETRWYPRLAMKAGFSRFRTAVTVRPEESAVAMGDNAGVDQDAAGWTYRFETDRPVEGMTIYAGAYAHAERQAGPVHVEAFTAPDAQGQAAALMAEAGRVIAFYGARYGRYPYRKLALVETDFPGGYGAASAVALPHAAFDGKAAADEFLPHELAHAWTDLLGYRGAWGERGFLAEGLASYLDMLYRGERDGAPAFREALQAAQNRYRRVWGEPGDVALAEAPPDLSRGAWQALAYDKGAVIWHMLRRIVGDKAFDQAIAGVYRDRQGQPTGVAEFQAAFEKASGQHLAYFFDQWLNRPGMPAFRFRDLRVAPASDGRYAIDGTLEQTGRAWAMGVPLVVLSNHADMLYQVPVKAGETRFRLMVKGRPKLLLLDPLGDVLLAPSPAVVFR